MTLFEALDLATQGKAVGWLFLPSDYELWTGDVSARFVDLDSLDVDPGTDEPILPAECVADQLRETLDADTIAECVRWADRLAGGADPAIRLKSFTYYVRFDAPLPAINAGDPPPWEETRRKLDLEFYDKLGPEDESQPCRHRTAVTDRYAPVSCVSGITLR